MTDVPAGAFTFLFTTIADPTSLWGSRGLKAWEAAEARHDSLTARVLQEHQPILLKLDHWHWAHAGVFAAFRRAVDAVAAALALQRALTAERWPTARPLRVQMALDTRDVELRDGGAVGAAAGRCARLLQFVHGGQVLLTAATHERVQADLPQGASLRDLGRYALGEPDPPERVSQLLHPDLRSDFYPPNNLPAPSNAFIGRARELAGVQELLQRDEVRLLTLTGPGGVGKTRLGLEIAAGQLNRFLDGVFFVPLAPIRDPGLVAATILKTLGVSNFAMDPDLKRHLHWKQMLLLLDHFEHVRHAAPIVAEALAAAPGLKVIVTSRTALGVPGEREWVVPPLALPPRWRRLPVVALARSVAVDLFVQRAIAVQPDFALTDENAPAVLEICRRLDALPLALELAATRVRRVSPRALLASLECRQDVLTGRARGLRTRSWTLRDTLTWSCELLEESERTLLRRLSVFDGDFSQEAAAAVCAIGPRVEDSGLRVEPDGNSSTLNPQPSTLLQEAWPVLAGLASPLDRRRFCHEDGAHAVPRFVLPEPLRDYGLALLTESGEAETIRRRHARYFLDWAERTKAQSSGPSAPARYEVELDEIRAALDGSLQSEDVETGLRLMVACEPFWMEWSHSREARTRLQRLLGSPAALERTAARARALHLAALLPGSVGEKQEARALEVESLEIGRELQDKEIIAAALSNLATLPTLSDYRADPVVALACYEECLPLYRELGNRPMIAWSLYHLAGLLSSQGDHDRAQALRKELLEIVPPGTAEDDPDWPRVFRAVHWEIRLLDQPRFDCYPGRVIDVFDSHMAGAVLAALALNRRPQSYEELIARLWPDAAPDVARERLDMVLVSLRRLLEAPATLNGRVEPAGGVLIRTEGETVWLEAGAFTTDVAAFEAAVERAERAGSDAERIPLLRQAARCYLGELLPDYTDAWIAAERQRLADLARTVWQGVIAHVKWWRDRTDARMLFERVTMVHLRDEAIHRDLIDLLAAVGCGEWEVERAKAWFASRQQGGEPPRRRAPDPLPEPAALPDAALPPERVAAHVRFSFRMLAAVIGSGSERNLFLSPVGIALAMHLTANGTGGRTRAAVMSALDLQDLDPAAVNQGNRALRAALSDPDPEVQLAIATALWVQHPLVLDAGFLATAAESYGAPATAVDLLAPATSGIVNDWVRRETRGMIPHLVSPGDLAGAVAFLTNAVYFKGAWSEPFDRASTREGLFTLADGSLRPLPMMSRQMDGRYYREEGFEAVSIPYGGGRITLDLFLPDRSSGLREFLPRLDDANWTRCQSAWSDERLDLVLPRFHVECTLALQEPLTALGMGPLFERTADFSPMGPGALYLTGVRHRAVLEVNEEGTVAAAATMGMFGSMTPPRPRRVVVDRPFFGVIRDRQTGALLFMGVIVDPGAST